MYSSLLFFLAAFAAASLCILLYSSFWPPLQQLLSRYIFFFLSSSSSLEGFLYGFGSFFLTNFGSMLFLHLKLNHLFSPALRALFLKWRDFLLAVRLIMIYFLRTYRRFRRNLGSSPLRDIFFLLLFFNAILGL